MMTYAQQQERTGALGERRDQVQSREQTARRQTQGNSSPTQQQTNALVHTYNHASKLPARAVRGWGYGRGVAHALQALAVRDGKPSTAPANHVPARAAVAAVQEQ